MKKILTIALLFSLLLTYGCNSNSRTPGSTEVTIVVAGKDPKKILSAFFDAIVKKDVPALRALSTKASKETIDIMAEGFSLKDKDNKILKFDAIKMEVAEPVITGDRAVVPVKEIITGQTLNYILLKENGSWKVALDENSLMNMGRIDPADMGKQIERVKYLDSLSRQKERENEKPGSAKED